MLKQLVLASSLMVSIPFWAATQAETVKTASESADVARAAATRADEAAAGKAASIQKDSARPAGKQPDKADAARGAPSGKQADGKQVDGKQARARDGQAEPSPERKALMEERRKQQVLVFHLRAKRDSELNRLALARLAASRGGDPDFNEKKNQKMIKQMQDLGADYDRQIAKAQLDLDKLDGRIARLDAREQGKGGKAGARPAGKAADAADGKAAAVPAAQANDAARDAAAGRKAVEAATQVGK